MLTKRHSRSSPASLLALPLLLAAAETASPGEAPRTFRHARPYVLTRREEDFIALREGKPVDDKDARGMTALHHAAARNFRTAAEFLLQKGAKINARDRRDYTPLAMAAA